MKITPKVVITTAVSASFLFLSWHWSPLPFKALQRLFASALPASPHNWCLEPAGSYWVATDVCPPPVLWASLRYLCQAGKLYLWQRNEAWDNVWSLQGSSCGLSSPCTYSFNALLSCFPWTSLCRIGLCFPAFYI